MPRRPLAVLFKLTIGLLCALVISLKLLTRRRLGEGPCGKRLHAQLNRLRVAVFWMQVLPTLPWTIGKVLWSMLRGDGRAQPVLTWVQQVLRAEKSGRVTASVCHSFVDSAPLCLTQPQCMACVTGVCIDGHRALREE